MSITGIVVVISLISHIYYNMDIVYVIGTGSRWDNNELRYSLRSICHHGFNLGQVYIVGDELPDFVDPGKVHYLHFCDSPNLSPYQNVFRKIQFFFGASTVNRFLLSSDDHFFIKPVDFDEWPLHYKGDHMPTEAQMTDVNIGDARYRRVLIRTAKFMEANGFDMRFFEGHTNKLYSRATWEYLQALGIEDYAMQEEGISLNSIMAGAMAGEMNPEYVIKRKDIKLKHLNTPEDWELLQGTESFSIYDSAIKTGVAGLLQVLFPDKCRFEK